MKFNKIGKTKFTPAPNVNMFIQQMDLNKNPLKDHNENYLKNNNSFYYLKNE